MKKLRLCWKSRTDVASFTVLKDDGCRENGRVCRDGVENEMRGKDCVYIDCEMLNVGFLNEGLVHF